MFSILRYLGDTYGVKERDIRARDLLQPPTYITIGSFLLTLNGSRKLDTPLGKLEVIIGRSGDAVDGVVARAFDMSSDAGAIADTVCDKLGMAAIALNSWRHNIVPKPVLAAMTVRHVASAAATLYNGLRDQDKQAIRPPKSGKLGMAADTAAIAAFMVADELKKRDANGERLVTTIGYVAAATGLIFGGVAVSHYMRGEFAIDDERPVAT